MDKKNSEMEDEEHALASLRDVTCRLQREMERAERLVCDAREAHNSTRQCYPRVRLGWGLALAVVLIGLNVGRLYNFFSTIASFF